MINGVISKFGEITHYNLYWNTKKDPSEKGSIFVWLKNFSINFLLSNPS